MRPHPLFALVVSFVALLAVAACVDDETETPTPEPSPTADVQPTATADAETPTPEATSTPSDGADGTPTATEPAGTPQPGDGTPAPGDGTPTTGAGQPVEFEQVSGGNLNCCGPEAPTIVVISSRGSSVLELLPGVSAELDRIDFETSYGVVLFRGRFASEQYEFEVTDAQLEGETLSLEVDLSGDPPDDPGQPGQSVSFPYRLIAVDKNDVSEAESWQVVTGDGEVIAQTRFPAQ